MQIAGQQVEAVASAVGSGQVVQIVGGRLIAAQEMRHQLAA
jgi:hypothetical protein